MFHVVDVFEQIGQTALHRFHVFVVQIGFFYAAVVFEGAHGGDDDGAIGAQTCQPRFDIAEFFRAQICAKARFGYGVVAQMLRQARCQHGIAAVRDVGKGPAVHQRGAACQRLHEVGLNGVFEQRRHCAVGVQIFGVNGLIIKGVGNQDVAQPLF